MKTPRRILRTSSWVALVLLAITAPGVAAAADRATGSISGRIQNVVSGQYLNNVRVSVKGTDLVAFTDQSGSYRLAGIPGGPVVLEVFYTGLDPQQIPLTVPPGQDVERDVGLTSVARYGDDGTVKLDSFVVSTSRETDGEAIAINEQRFAANIKNVVAAETLGDVMDGNVGEFLKFLPGITAEYDTESGGSVASVSVRGFPTSMAVLSADGLQMANTGNPQGSSRVFQFKEVSINNISRLEVTKVPTPATPADSLAGSIDMVSKSAFERKSAQLRYSVSLAGIHEHLSLQKVPHTSDRKVYKVLPSFSFDYTLPLTKTFGLVLTGQSGNRWVEQQRVPRGYNAAGTNTGASISRPFLQSFQLTSVPRANARNSVGVKADWRATPSGVLSLNLERSRFVSDRSQASIGLTTGTNATPTPATGTPMTFGENFTNGATGRGGVTLMGTGASVIQKLDTKAANLRYRFDNGTWRVVAGFGKSNSEGGYQDTRDGRFRTLGIAMLNPVRVTFADINDVRPQTIRVFDNANREVDIYDSNNYRLNTAQSTPRPIIDSLTNGKLDIRRSLGFLSFPAAVQVGGLHRAQTRDVRRESINWTYNGLDGNAATPESPAPYRVTTYVNQRENFGFRNMPWVSLYKAWDAFKANPSLFSKTPAQVVAEEQFRINNSERLKEAVSALYAQAELGLFRNRLKVLTGVRYEKTTADGEGVRYDPNAVWLRSADGSFAHTAAAARIRRPEAGAAGSLEELRLTRQDRGDRASRSYDGYYPSAHLTYHLKENLLLRAAYAKTYGRPDFANIIPNATIDETDFNDNVPDPSLVPGRITIRNTGLRPWSADNYDLSIEYYTDQGGLFSAGLFRKDIKNFFGDTVKLATVQDLQALELDPRYVGWQLSTTYNLPGRARVTGFEFNVRHSLRSLGAWGRYFQGFVNGTKLELDGDRDAEFSGFIPESANWGFNFSRRPFAAMAKWNYRGEQQRGRQPGLGPDAYEYVKARVTLDVNIDYQLRPNLFLYFNGQNVFNVPETLLRYGSQTPAYARRYQVMTHGVQLTLGVKGTF
ncbi:MAG: TonB-dependent receptor [Verrucomicrobia bacterium]|nr:TonB-dependent receptor [Verrucomicrobiota bacterium]